MNKTDVVAVFDIGKTNKKILLFDSDLKLVFEQESRFEEIPDDDGFLGDDIERLENWMMTTLTSVIKDDQYNIKALNITTYGATVMYIDERGNRLTPVYNYLKPMPDEVLEGFYDTYGGKDEFCRKTASPALGMLNSGLQILWLKRKKYDVFAKAKSIMHFPQYLSYLFTGNITSEYTSIGCHTAMWDFDNHQYHIWLQKEGIRLPIPISNNHVDKVEFEGFELNAGIGIHDSSASLVPYFMGTQDQFILISTGTWCIFMNPFNTEPLTAEQLAKDSLCYMSIQQQQVKSSRLFMGHIHDVNVERLTRHFNVPENEFKTVKADTGLLASIMKGNEDRIFFRNGVSVEFTDTDADLKIFSDFKQAYTRFMIDLVDVGMESLRLIIPSDDQ